MSARAPEPSYEAAARGWQQRAIRAEEEVRAGVKLYVAALDRAERAERERDEAREHAAELDRLFDLQQRRMREAVALWRGESPAERELVLPDLGDLLAWLMARPERAEATIGRVRTLAAEFQSERPNKIANVHFVAAAILAALDGTDNTGGTDGKA